MKPLEINEFNPHCIDPTTEELMRKEANSLSYNDRMCRKNYDSSLGPWLSSLRPWSLAQWSWWFGLGRL